MLPRVKRYYWLTKPGIVYGNDLSVITGLLLASIHYHVFKPVTLVLTLVGISLVMASGCVFNNYLDRGLDAKMKRTKNRALVDGSISGHNALIFASTLGLVGLLLVEFSSNTFAMLLGFAGLISYVILYGIAKRRTIYGTEVGSISGAIPPLVGYVAISGKIDAGAVILFLLLVFWQMPHFFGIAMYRLKDYQQAGIPVLPAIKGMKQTKVRTTVYIVLFIATLPLLTFYGYSGYIYLVMMLALSLYWLWMGIRNFTKLEDPKWGRKIFLFSLIVLLMLTVSIPVGALLS